MWREGAFGPPGRFRVGRLYDHGDHSVLASVQGFLEALSLVLPCPHKLSKGMVACPLVSTTQINVRAGTVRSGKRVKAFGPSVFGNKQIIAKAHGAPVNFSGGVSPAPQRSVRGPRPMEEMCGGEGIDGGICVEAGDWSTGKSKQVGFRALPSPFEPPCRFGSRDVKPPGRRLFLVPPLCTACSSSPIPPPCAPPCPWALGPGGYGLWVRGSCPPPPPQGEGRPPQEEGQSRCSLIAALPPTPSPGPPPRPRPPSPMPHAAFTTPRGPQGPRSWWLRRRPSAPVLEGEEEGPHAP